MQTQETAGKLLSILNVPERATSRLLAGCFESGATPGFNHNQWRK